MNKFLGRALPYLSSALLCFLIFGWTYGRHFQLDWSAPFQALYDGEFGVMLVKGLMTHEWFPFLGVKFANIGAPYGSRLSGAYPNFMDQLQYFLMWVLGFFSSKPMLVYNLYYFLGFVLCSWSMLFALTSLRVSQAVAITVGLIFAFLPFHFMRYHHPPLGGYFLVPICILVLLRLWGKKPLTRLGMVSCFVVGTWQVYYAFFFCLFVGIASLSAALYRKSWRNLVAGAVAIGLVLAGFALVTIPTVVYRMQDKLTEKSAFVRPTVDTEIYALKLTNMLMPQPTHRIAYFRELKKRYVSASEQREGKDEYVGFAAILGMLVLLFCLLRLKETSVHSKLAVLFAAGFMYATYAGFGSLFSLTVNPSMRSINRMSVFLTGIALFSLAFFVDHFLKRHSKVIRLAGCSALFLVAIFDQIDPDMRFYDEEARVFRSDAVFVGQIEKALAPGSSVLQLPYLGFPESGGGYPHYRGYIHSDTLKWSYGAVAGSAGAEKLRALSVGPVNLAAVRAFGFQGIYFDRRLCSDFACDASYEKQLKDQLGAPLESADKRLAFYRL